GGLLTYHICRYDLLHIVQLRIGFRGNGEQDWIPQICRHWLLILLLVFGGSRVGSLSFQELRRRLTGRSIQDGSADGGPGPIAAILSFVLAPIMVLWGAVSARVVLNWFVLWPGRNSMASLAALVRSQGTAPLFDVCRWWLTAIALTAGGIVIFWTGVRS